jgi:hypothetical protein
MDIWKIIVVTLFILTVGQQFLIGQLIDADRDIITSINEMIATDQLIVNILEKIANVR